MGLGSGGPGPSSDRTPTDSRMIMIKERPWISVLFPISPLHLLCARSLLKLSDHCHTPFPSLSLSLSFSLSLTHTVLYSETSNTLKNKRTEPGLGNMSRSLPVMLRSPLLCEFTQCPFHTTAQQAGPSQTSVHLGIMTLLNSILYLFIYYLFIYWFASSHRTE